MDFKRKFKMFIYSSFDWCEWLSGQDDWIYLIKGYRFSIELMIFIWKLFEVYGGIV